MILIKSIEIVEIDRDPVEIVSQISPHESIRVYSEGKPTDISHKVLTEYVRGRVFVNMNGQRINIGMSQKVQELIGLQFEAYENMQAANQKLRTSVAIALRDLNVLKSRLVLIQERSWLTKLVDLFMVG